MLATKTCQEYCTYEKIPKISCKLFTNILVHIEHTVYTPMQNPGIVSVWSSQSKQPLSPAGYIKSGVTLRDMRLFHGELKLCLALYLQLDQTAGPSSLSALLNIQPQYTLYSKVFTSMYHSSVTLWNLYLNLQPAINHKGNMQQDTIKQKAQGK